jgi:hypothetical protein
MMFDELRKGDILSGFDPRGHWQWTVVITEKSRHEAMMFNFYHTHADLIPMDRENWDDMNSMWQMYDTKREIESRFLRTKFIRLTFRDSK